MNPTKRALLDAVLANPKDTVAKLVYADWLEENEPDDPRSAAHAETIRLQIRHTGNPAVSAEYARSTPRQEYPAVRFRKLCPFREHGITIRAWDGGGFPCAVEGRFDVLRKHLKDVVREYPIRVAYHDLEPGESYDTYQWHSNLIQTGIGRLPTDVYERMAAFYKKKVLVRMDGKKFVRFKTRTGALNALSRTLLSLARGEAESEKLLTV